MVVTVFNSTSSKSKVPTSPYGNKVFSFEKIIVQNIKEIFDKIASRFVLNIPLQKNIKAQRTIAALEKTILPKIDYLILDIDKVKSQSDRELVLDFFRKSPWEVILGASRSPFNLKGVIKLERMPYQQGKEVLREIQEKIEKVVPCKIDLAGANRVYYQAPINQHQVLLHKQGTQYPRPSKKEIVIPKKTTVTDEIEQLCIDAFRNKGFSFNKILAEGYQCSHPSEKKSPNGFTWSRRFPYDITHWNPDRKVSVWDEIRVTPMHRNHQKKESKNLVKSIIPTPPTSGQDVRYLGNCTKEVSDFLNNKQMLKISSPMGTAKSNVIEEVIHQAGKLDLKILFITNRISLAEDIYRKYDGLKYYLGTEVEDNKYKQGDNLVVQVDSLHKFKVKFFDLVIIDEAATTLMHLLSLENHLVQTSKQIFSLKEKKIVLADAFLFDEMTDIFADKSETIHIDNLYKDNVNLEFYSQKDNFINDIIQEAKIRPITFSSGSTKVLDVISHMAQINKLKTVTISGETPKNEKELIYAQMQNKKASYDILMFSPTLTVGVSNVNKIDSHYHYDTGQSMNVLSSIQMVKRTRTAKSIKFFLQEKIQYNPVNLDKIQVGLTEFHDTDDYGDSIGVSKTGIEFSRLQRIHNIMENRHKEAFLELLKMQFVISEKNVINNTAEIKPFFARLSKLITKKKQDDALVMFDEYRKMSPNELQDDEYKLFDTSKAKLIQSFQDIRLDETLNLSQAHIDKLIIEEIKNPGIIDAYKLNLSNNKKFPDLKKRVLSKNKKEQLSMLGIEITDMGFKKTRQIWEINKTISLFI